MKFQYNDGGRADAGYRGQTGDCTCRAIAIATGKPYQDVYDALNGLAASERRSKRNPRKSSARTGVSRRIYEKYLFSLGWEWVPTMQIGQGCKVHLRDGELPSKGSLVVRLSKHLTAVVDGVIQDTYEDSRDGTRCVYGYFRIPLQKSLTTSGRLFCANPLCKVSITPLTGGWRRSERRFCSDKCRMDGYVLRRAAEMLKQVGAARFAKILEGRL